MNAKVIKELKAKVRRFAQAKNLSKDEENRAYNELKKMYLESSIKERKELGL